VRIIVLEVEVDICIAVHEVCSCGSPLTIDELAFS